MLFVDRLSSLLLAFSVSRVLSFRFRFACGRLYFGDWKVVSNELDEKRVVERLKVKPRQILVPVNNFLCFLANGSPQIKRTKALR